MCIVYAIDSALEVQKSFHLALIHHAPKHLYIASFLNRLQIHDIMTVLMDYHACGQYVYHVIDKGAQYYKIMTARDRKVVSAQVNPFYSIVLVYILQFWEVYYADDLTG